MAMRVVKCIVTEGEPILGHQPEFKRNCVEEGKLIQAGVIPTAWVKRGYLEMCDAHKRKMFGFTTKEKAQWVLTTGSEAEIGHMVRRMIEAGLNPRKYMKQ